MEQGMAYIRPYYNKACTEPLEEVNGVYNYTGNIISSNVLNPYRINIWLRNDGSHKAYDVEITDVTSNFTPTNTFVKKDIYSLQVKQCAIEVTIPKGYVGTINLSFKLNYDSV